MHYALFYQVLLAFHLVFIPCNRLLERSQAILGNPLMWYEAEDKSVNWIERNILLLMGSPEDPLNAHPLSLLSSPCLVCVHKDNALM